MASGPSVGLGAKVLRIDREGGHGRPGPVALAFDNGPIHRSIVDLNRERVKPHPCDVLTIDA